jgi:hypothetical protein
MFRELDSNEVESVSGGAGTATYSNGSWSYGNSCYATAQGAANAGATGFQVGNQYFGTPGGVYDGACVPEDGCLDHINYQQDL